MSALTDLTDKAKENLQSLFEKIQETSLYIRLSERFENMSPRLQKLVLSLIALIIAYLFLTFPLSTYDVASEKISIFEGQRQLVQDLFKVSTAGQIALPVDPPPPLNDLKSQIESRLQQAQLLPEQLKGVSLDSVPAYFPEQIVDGAISVSLAKLNLRQVVDIGYQIQSISTGMKMIDLVVQANRTDGRYFDVIYKLMTLKVPQFTAPPVVDEKPDLPPKKAED